MVPVCLVGKLTDRQGLFSPVCSGVFEQQLAHMEPHKVLIMQHFILVCFFLGKIWKSLLLLLRIFLSYYVITYC